MSWDHSRGKTAQEQHNEQVTSKPRIAPGSKKKLEAMLKAKGAPSDRSQSDGSDWVAPLLKNNPALTREDVAEMVKDLGF